MLASAASPVFKGRERRWWRRLHEADQCLGSFARSMKHLALAYDKASEVAVKMTAARAARICAVVSGLRVLTSPNARHISIYME